MVGGEESSSQNPRRVGLEFAVVVLDDGVFAGEVAGGVPGEAVGVLGPDVGVEGGDGVVGQGVGDGGCDDGFEEGGCETVVAVGREQSEGLDVDVGGLGVVVAVEAADHASDYFGFWVLGILPEGDAGEIGGGLGVENGFVEAVWVVDAEEERVDSF